MTDRPTPYPPEFADRYRSANLWRDRTIASAFGEIVRAHASRPALITADHRWTYVDLARKSDAVAAGLLALGLRPGEAVVLQVTNTAWTVAAWYGLLKAGLVPVCTLATHRRHEIEQIARQAGASAHLVQADLPGFDLVGFADDMRALVPSLRMTITIGGRGDAGIESLADRRPSTAELSRLRDIDEHADPQSPAVYQLSGGTTGTPKIIPRLHAEYWYNAVATACWWELGSSDRLAFGLPLVHNAGVVNAMHAAHSVGAALLLSTPAPDDILPLMAEHRATWTMSPPGLAAGYLGHPRFEEAFADVRDYVLTAARVPGDVFDALTDRGVHVVQAFGMTEGLLMFTPSHASAKVRAATVGLPISPLDEVLLLQPGSLEPVEPGAIGELCARGPYTIRGYLGEPERNIEAFTPDGFYRSGDLVRAHDIDGLTVYSVEGRVKDMINRGGEKFNAEEVEALLLRHEAIIEAAVVAMPDDRLGERACAYLVVRPGHGTPSVTDLGTFLETEGLAKYKWPERVERIAALPRTSVGKVGKRELRDDVTRRLAEPRAGSITLPAGDYLRVLIHGATAFALLRSGLELDLFDWLADADGMTIGEFAAAAGIQEQPARVLLLGLCSLRLLEKRGDEYVNSEVVRRKLTRGGDRYLGPLVDMQSEVINPAMADLTESIRRGTNVGLRHIEGPGSTLYERLTAHPRLQKVFYDNMGDASTQAFAQVLEHYDFTSARHVVDLCGGDGTNSLELARRYPLIEATVFDQPSVTELAAGRVEDPDLRRRVRFYPGDLLTDPLPQGADTILYFHVFQIWSLERNTEVLRKCHEALAEGGVCLVYDWVSNDEGTGSLSAGLLSPYFLNLASGEGMTYSCGDVEKTLVDAGFGQVERYTALGFSHALVVGRKDGGA